MDTPDLRSRVQIALLALLTASCGDDQPSADPCTYAVCAIDDPACVEKVAETVACNLDQDPIYPATSPAPRPRGDIRPR